VPAIAWGAPAAPAGGDGPAAVAGAGSSREPPAPSAPAPPADTPPAATAGGAEGEDAAAPSELPGAGSGKEPATSPRTAGGRSVGFSPDAAAKAADEAEPARAAAQPEADKGKGARPLDMSPVGPCT
jgi:hypothetical protein